MNLINKLFIFLEPSLIDWENITGEQLLIAVIIFIMLLFVFYELTN